MKTFRPAIASFAPRTSAWRITRAARWGARWPALRLQWRRNAKTQAAHATAGGRPAPAPSWPAAIALHFSVMHQVTNMFSARAQALPAAPQPMSLKNATVAHGAPRHAAAEKPGSPARPMRAPAAPTALVWRARRTAALPALTLPSARRAHAVPGVLRLAISSRAPALHLAWKATRSPIRQAALRAATSQRTHEAPAAAAALGQARAPALVWRKAAAAPKAQEVDLPAAGASMLFASAPVTQHPAPISAAPAAATLLAPVRQQLQATSLAPALAERLADEVIRRVERSMRIERERRGR